MPASLSRLAGTLALIVAVTSSLGAQPLPDGILFDDFTYMSTAWSLDARKQERGSLYGPNAWRVGQAPSDTVAERAWYRAYWREMNDFYDSTAVEVADGRLRIEARAGTYAAAQRHPQVASGFTAVTGTWAARVRFSDLGAVPFYTTGRHQGWPEVDIMQSFWTLSPYRVRKGDGWAWSEMDHEFNNWFGRARRTERGARLYVDTGFFENGMAYPFGMKGAGGDAYTCTRTRGGQTEQLRPTACAAALLPNGDRPAPFVTLLIQHDGSGVRFALRLDGSTEDEPIEEGRIEDGRIEMVSERLAETVPSQPMMAMFSMYLKDHEEAPVFDLDTPQAMDVDWFFYAEDIVDLDTVTDHIATIRDAEVTRLNTLGRPAAFPYVACDTRQPWPDWKTCPWPRIASPKPEFDLRLYAPPTLSTGCLREGATWIVRPPLRATTYEVRWRSRYHYRDRAPSRWHRTDEVGFRYQLPRPSGAPFYVELDVEVEDTQPLMEQEARGQTRRMVPVLARGEACTAPVDPDPLATAPR
ncbi:MAG: hypothetical protein AAFV01_10745 [Bacteroidota bacterium]